MRIVVVTLALMCAGATAIGSDLMVIDLKTEFQTDPMGVDVERPRLSWILSSPTRGQRQTAYQILVASAPHLLVPGVCDVWDTKRVESDESHVIPYAGEPLLPGKTYFWSVRVWDREGSASMWSQPARWTMGRMGVWGDAQWIGLDSLSHASLGMRRDQLPLLRREFDLGKPVKRAVVHYTGLGFVELYVNGTEATDEVLTPGWTNIEKSILYSTNDVTHLLREGKNGLGVALGHGMYHIPGTPGDGRFAKFFGPLGDPKLILFLTVEHTDGTTTTITSDSNWLVAGGPTTFSSIWGGEDYDARLELPGWSRAGFEDSSWVHAPVLQKPGGMLLATAAPPIRSHEVFKPVAITTPAPGIYVYDLGQNHAGWMWLSVRGPAGATVKLRPSEILGPDGFVDQSSMQHDGEIYFRYTLQGSAIEHWHPHFTYTGYRYLQIENATPDPEKAEMLGIPLVVDLESRFIHAAAPVAGRVATSSPMLNGIHRMIVEAIRSNTMSVITDCPHREKLGWLEQAHLHAPGIQFNLDAATLYAKWTQDMAEAQLPSGLVPDIAPEFTVFEDGFRDSPEWGSAFILAPMAAYQHYGDAAPLHDHFEAMKQYVDYLESKRDMRGLLAYGLGDWYDIAPGPPGRSKLTTAGLTATAIYYADLGALAKIAVMSGSGFDALDLNARAANVKQAFNDAFFDVARGRYDTGSQTAQAMPLVLGLVPEGREQEVLGHLVADIEGRDAHTTAGDIGHRYVVLALMEAGRSDLVYDMAVNPTPPSYAAQLLSGATTLTEAWDADPESSQNHFMLGHLEEWLYSGIGGLSALEPGFRTVEIAPHPIDALTWAEVTYSSVRGQIRSSWKRTDSGLFINIYIPPGVTGVVRIPVALADDVSESGIPISDADEVSNIRAESGNVILEIGSGEYRFFARDDNK